MADDELMDDSDLEESNREDEKVFSIFDDTHATQYITADGKKRWRCEWCKKDFSLWNATKALQHLTKQPKCDIAPCRGRIDEKSMTKYQELLDKKNKSLKQKKSNNDSIQNSLVNINESSARKFEDSRSKFKKNRISDVSSFASTPSSMITPSTKKSIQLKIHNGPNPQAESLLTMAIGDFIHSCGLPFRIASHPKFRLLISLARAVGSNFRFPSRNQIATELLDINYDTYMTKSRGLLERDIEIFGISFYGDGATVKRMPLINVLASGAYIHTVVMEIVDATIHLKTGGVKDAEYISSLFVPHIRELENVNPHCVDYCTFDGAASVQCTESRKQFPESFVHMVANM